MREALLIVILVVLVVAGLGNARIALLGYIWFAIMRPDILAWAPDRSYSLMLGLVASLSCLREIYHLFPALQIRWLVLLMTYWFLIIFSVMFSTHLELSLFMLRIFFPTMLTATLIPVVLRRFEDIRMLFLVMAFSLGFLGLKFGLWGVLAGGVSYTQGYGGSLSDNNLFALGMVVGLPLCWYARDLVKDWKWKLMFLSFCIFMPAAIVMSHSRGGILAFGCALLFVVWYSRRRVLSFVLLGCFVLGSAFLVKDSLMERMGTLKSVEDDASAQGRLTHWVGAFKMSLDYPIFGVGFGGLPYAENISRYLDYDSAQFAHNNYLQMAADSGYPATIIFCLLQFGMMIWFRSVGLKFKGRDPAMYSMAMAMCASLVGFAVGSVFLSRTFYETVYYIFGFGAAMSPVVQQRLEALNASPAPQVVIGPEAPASAPAPAVERPPARYKLGGRQRVLRQP
jgi:putative inorganic carbon (hco3(-)) transporter